MQFVRKALLVLIAPLLALLLYATAIDVGFVRIATHPATIKKIISDSGVYSSAVTGLLDQAKNISSGSGDNVSLIDPTVRDAAQKTFTPQYLQTNTETVIDSVYAWLDGKTPLPDFQIDLTGQKAAFAANAAQAITQRLAALPACTTAAQDQNFDPQTATCLPKGLSPTSEAAAVQNSIASGQGFLDHPVINAESVKSGDGKPSVFADQLKNAPDGYQKAKKTPAVLVIATVFVALIIVLLSSTRTKGLRRVGVTLLVVGLFVLVFAWGINYAVTKKLPDLKLNNAVLQDKVKILITDLVQNIDKTYWIIGGVYVALGVAAIGSAMMLNRGNKGGKSKDDLEGEGKTKEDRIDLKEPDKPVSLDEKSEKPAAKPKTPAAKPPARRSIKIQ